MPLAAWFDLVLHTTAELEYAEALQWFGLRFRPGTSPNVDDHGKAWLGLKTSDDAGRVLVSEVVRDTPAYGTGISVGDEVVAIDDYRVRPGQLDGRLEQYRPGDVVGLTVSRREHLLRVTITLGAEPAKRWTVEADPAATDEQKAHLDDWLSPKAQGSLFGTGDRRQRP